MLFARLWTLALGLSAALLAVPAAAQDASKPFTFSVARAVPTLDPYHTTVREATLVAGPLVFDTLVWRDPKTGEFKPQLATSWRYINETTLEFKLRTDVKFHDGRTFGADDVVYTINYALKPESKLAQPSFVNWIKSAQKVNQNTVRLHLVRSFGPALEYLSNLVPIMPVGAYDKNPTALTDYIGTGPYRVAQYDIGKSIEFALTNSYPQGLPKSVAKLKTIRMRMFADKNAELGEFLAGNTDWIWQFSGDQAKRIQSYPNIELKYSPTIRVRFLELDASGKAGVAALKNVKVRQAMGYAINRDRIRTALTEPGTMTINAVCYTTQLGCQDPTTTYTYDPAKAKALLAEAGYPSGFKVDLFSFRDKTWSEAIAADLAAVGINASVKVLDYVTVIERRRAHETPMIDQTWGSNSINDASAVLDVFFGATGNAMSEDADLAKLLDDARSNTNDNKRRALYKQALELINKNAYAIPLFAQATPYAFRTGFVFTPYADEIPRFYEAYWK